MGHLHDNTLIYILQMCFILSKSRLNIESINKERTYIHPHTIPIDCKTTHEMWIMFCIVHIINLFRPGSFSDWSCRGRDRERMVVGFTTTCAIRDYLWFFASTHDPMLYIYFLTPIPHCHHFAFVIVCIFVVHYLICLPLWN
jgi:hypothetical protein